MDLSSTESSLISCPPNSSMMALSWQECKQFERLRRTVNRVPEHREVSEFDRAIKELEEKEKLYDLGALGCIVK